MPPKKAKTKVLVCLSGGVDSSVAAALLLEQGYDVTGAFMKQWSDTKELSGVCSWKEDRRDALRVAAHLGIPLLTLDFEKEYKEWVMGYMFDEYKKGRTPNPDVLCNKWIKFGFWLERALSLGFTHLATGHYARIGESGIMNHESGNGKDIPDSQFLIQLLEAKDKNKDQTYFLHQLTQKQLQHVLFPIGGYTKPQVRALARKFKLPTAERAESMGICFVGEIPIKEFLQQKIKSKPGKILVSSGEVVGEHDGLAFYTIGQRHFGARSSEPTFGPSSGRGLANRGDDSKPLFVVAKNQKKNELVVGYEDDPLLWRQEIEVGKVNWVSGPAFALRRATSGKQVKGKNKVSRHEEIFTLECKVRLRHRQTMQNAELRMQNKRLIVRCKKPQKAVTPGQFAVFYKKGECLGGGVIV